MAAPDRSTETRLRRAAIRLCLARLWAPVAEMSLPNGRRADILAVQPDGRIVIIEVKSSRRDFETDRKWPEYLDYADFLFFAVAADFPQAILPSETGLILCHEDAAEIVRDAPMTPLAPARRRSILIAQARLAALRLALKDDPKAAPLAGMDPASLRPD